MHIVGPVTVLIAAVNVLRYRGRRIPEDEHEGNLIAEASSPFTGKNLFFALISFLILVSVVIITIFTGDNKLETQSSGVFDVSHSHACIPPDGDKLIGSYGKFAFCRSFEPTSKSGSILFSQGLNHLYGFNRIEAARNFRAAIVEDVDCISCHIALAMSKGPNVNNPMEEANLVPALTALNTAADLHSKKFARRTNQYEILQVLLNTTKSRFPNSTAEWKRLGQPHFDQAYANQVQKAYNTFPLDDDIAALYAESIMMLTPWKYHTNINNKYDHIVSLNPGFKSEPISMVQPAIDALEKILQRQLYHPLALHMYIHITEQSHDPGQGER